MAKIEVIITDMGNGGAYCSNCGQDLDHGDPFITIPNHCPKCKEPLTERSEPYINQGGSDF